MRVPTEDDVRELLAWRPTGGVISVYVDLRPEDRGEPWRIELRNGLASVFDEVATDGASRRALEATAERIRDRFPADGGPPSGRTQIGFVEVAAKHGREEWFAAQVPLARTEVAHDRRPMLGPLVAILDGGAPRGVAAVSAERVRLMRWSLGATEEIESWGLEIFSLDWRERKAQRPGDPARVHGAKASGRDQFDQRLEANRERFLREAGRLAGPGLEARDCAELLVFGDPEHARLFAEGAGERLTVIPVSPHNVISEPLAAIGDKVGEYVVELQRQRELELIERVKAEAHGGERGALGAEETSQALAEGRVAHLVLDPNAAADAERMVEMALETSARVTPIADAAAAAALAEAEGVAALLRY
jgi:hypothetical protein